MSASKQLFRSRKNRVIAGVCGGIAENYNWDPTVVRLVAVALSLVFGSAIAVYFAAWFIMPEEPLQEIQPHQ